MNSLSFLKMILRPVAMPGLAAEQAVGERATAKPDVGTGRIAWFDLTSSNLPKSKEFYGKLFGWTFDEVIGSKLAEHIVSVGKRIGTMRVAHGEIGENNGVVYVQVDDILESCKKAKSLGGTIPDGFPFNLPANGGAIALVSDPTGQQIGMYSHTAFAETK